MKESNILAGNATNNFLSRENLVNTKRQCMKEINVFAATTICGSITAPYWMTKKMHKINYTGVITKV